MMRYVLYVDAASQGGVLDSAPRIRKQTLIQPVAQIQVPDWLKALPLPVLVDKMSFQAYYGTHIDIHLQEHDSVSTKKRNFAKVDDLDS